MKIVGIYKITSPTGRVYIGQSRDIKARLNKYIKRHSANETQIRLMRSFNKHGVDNHVFEIVEECSFELINERERYWQDFYNVIGRKGLNCILQETSELPRKTTEEYRNSRSGENHFMYGKTHSAETKRKMSASAKLRKASKQTKKKLSSIRKGVNNSFYGKTHSEQSRKKMSESAKNRWKNNKKLKDK